MNKAWTGYLLCRASLFGRLGIAIVLLQAQITKLRNMRTWSKTAGKSAFKPQQGDPIRIRYSSRAKHKRCHLPPGWMLSNGCCSSEILRYTACARPPSKPHPGAYARASACWWVVVPLHMHNIGCLVSQGSRSQPTRDKALARAKALPWPALTCPHIQRVGASQPSCFRPRIGQFPEPRRLSVPSSLSCGVPLKLCLATIKLALLLHVLYNIHAFVTVIWRSVFANMRIAGNSSTSFAGSITGTRTGSVFSLRAIAFTLSVALFSYIYLRRRSQKKVSISNIVDFLQCRPCV